MVDDLGSEGIIEVYYDESHSRGGWDVLASLWLPRAGSVELRADILRVRRLHDWPGAELKWRKASGSRVHPAYLDMVDVGIDALHRWRGEFRVLVIEQALTRVRAWGGPSREASLFRAWEFILGEFIHPGIRHFVCLDDRTLRNRLRLREMRLALHKRYSHLLPAVAPPVAGIIMRRSDSDDLLQLVDIFAGAIGYHVSGQHRRAAASPGKTALAEAICQRLGRSDLGEPSCRSPLRVVRVRRAEARFTGTATPLVAVDVDGLTEARQTRILAISEIIATAA